MKLLSLPPARFTLVTIFFCFLAQTSNVWAQWSAHAATATGLQTGTNGQEHIRVVGHLDLNGMHVNQMFVEHRGDKTYLFLHRPAKQAYALVDVSNPEKPVLVERNAVKGNGQVEGPATGSVFAVTVTPDSGSTPGASASPLPTESVNLIDMSDPKKVKTVKTFKGVTSIYPENGRKLVYIVNNEGLWVVSHRMTHPLPLCNSESALTPEPDCQ